MRTINLLSVVIPCHNEEEALPATYVRLNRVLCELFTVGRINSYELIFVDNGSTDNTLNALKDIFNSDCNVKILTLRRNFGYQGSISAGMFYAKGDAVVTIDADLQDPPEKVGEMISFYEQGYDLVLGVRSDRSTDSFIKRYCASSYYRLLKMMGVEIVYNHGDFRLMSKALIQEFNALPERNRFIRGMILQLDSKYAVVPYKRELRRAGKSKFDIRSLFSFSIDGVISFSYLPLRISAIIGFIISLMTILCIAWVLYIKFVDMRSIPGWASTLLPMLCLGGLQLLFLGIIGEYIGRLYIEVKQRPLFIVREEYSHDERR
jgi:glycosyltransferase involved in cell wall biosynthesis